MICIFGALSFHLTFCMGNIIQMRRFFEFHLNKKKKCRNRVIAVVTRGHCFSLLWLRQTFEFEISGAGKKNGRRWWPPFFFWPKKNFSFEYFSFCTKISQGLGVFDGRLGQQHFVGQFRVQQNQGNHGNPTLIHLTLIQFKFSKN